MTPGARVIVVDRFRVVLWTVVGMVSTVRSGCDFSRFRGHTRESPIGKFGVCFFFQLLPSGKGEEGMELFRGFKSRWNIPRERMYFVSIFARKDSMILFGPKALRRFLQVHNAP